MQPGRADLVRCVILGVLCTVSVVAAYINLNDEPGVRHATLSWTLIWASIPIAVLATYLLPAISAGDYRLNFRQATAVLSICVMMYAYYALNGSTADKPETAAHMHILTVPILLALALAIPVAQMWAAVISRARVRNQVTHAP